MGISGGSSVNLVAKRNSHRKDHAEVRDGNEDSDGNETTGCLSCIQLKSLCISSLCPDFKKTEFKIVFQLVVQSKCSALTTCMQVTLHELNSLCLKICAYTYIHAITVNKEVLHLKESGEGCMRGFGRKKGGEKCNFIIFSKKTFKVTD